MLRKCTAVILIVGMLLVMGCATHIHRVGKGPQGKDLMIARQWYVLFGYVPINKVDTNAMAGEATDYVIVTQATGLDVIISIFTSVVSVNSRTVIVRK